MNLSVLLAEQISVLAIMMLIGFLAVKCNLITEEESKPLSKFCLYILNPCALIDAFQIDFSVDKLKAFLLAFVSAVIIHLVYFMVAGLSNKVFHFQAVEIASIEYTNAVYLVVPIVTYVLGKEYVFYASAYMLVQTALIWTHAISIIKGEKEISLKNIITNPNIITIVAGIIMFVSGIRFPSLIGQAITRTGSTVGPISMIIIGILIGTADLKAVLTRKKTWIVMVMKLLIGPAIIVCIMWITGASHWIYDSERILYVSFLAAAMPSASFIPMMANMFHKEEILASSINVMTVLFSILSLPLLTVLYQTLCM